MKFLISILLLLLVFALPACDPGISKSQEMVGTYHMTWSADGDEILDPGRSYLELTIDSDGNHRGTSTFIRPGFRNTDRIGNWVYSYDRGELYIDFPGVETRVFDVTSHAKTIKFEEADTLIIWEK